TLHDGYHERRVGFAARPGHLRRRLSAVPQIRGDSAITRLAPATRVCQCPRFRAAAAPPVARGRRPALGRTAPADAGRQPPLSRLPRFSLAGMAAPLVVPNRAGALWARRAVAGA